MMNRSHGYELYANVLLASKLFDLSDYRIGNFITLEGDALTTYLYACYGAIDAFYLYDEDYALIVKTEGEVIRNLVPSLFKVCSYRDLRERAFIDYYRIMRDAELLRDIILGDNKCVVLTPRPVDELGRVAREIYDEISDYGLEPTDVLIIPNALIDLRTEPELLIFITGYILRKRGYLVTEHNFGTGILADLFAYRDEWFGNGALLMELLLGTNSIEEGETSRSAIIVENEAYYRVREKRHGIAQVLEYLSEGRGAYELGYVTAPLMDEDMIREIRERDLGCVTFDEDGKIAFAHPKRHSYPLSKQRQSVLLNNVNFFLKYMPSLDLE